MRFVPHAMCVQVNNPELGRLEGRVKRIYLDALLEDDIDMEETKYWFSTPEGTVLKCVGFGI